VFVLEYLIYRETEHPGQNVTALSIINWLVQCGIERLVAYDHLKRMRGEGFLVGNEITPFCSPLLEKRGNDTQQATALTPVTPVTPVTQEPNEGNFDSRESFLEVFAVYPSEHQIGKDRAWKSWIATVKTPEDVTLFRKALEHYLTTEAVKAGKIKDAKTFFQEWTDFARIAEAHGQKVDDLRQRNERALAQLRGSFGQDSEQPEQPAAERRAE
jgi:hypothetical protein